MGTMLLLIASILKIIPIVLEMIQAGKIKSATEAEVLNAFEEEFTKRFNARIKAAADAGNAASASNVPDTSDPFDRANKGK